MPVINDLVIFVYNDSNHAKEFFNWRLRRVVEVLGTKVSLKYSVKAKGVKQTLVRSLRDISIVDSVREMLINTQDHLMSVPSYLILRRSNPILSFSILMSKVCSIFVGGGVTIVEYCFDLIATADAPLGYKCYTLSLFFLLDLLGSAGLIIWRDLQGVAEIIIFFKDFYLQKSL